MTCAPNFKRSEGGTLLRKLRRLTARAGTAKAGDRAQLLALIDDVQTVRRKLMDECWRLDGEMKRATFRITAIRAYARVASAIRPSRRNIARTRER